MTTSNSPASEAILVASLVARAGGEDDLSALFEAACKASGRFPGYRSLLLIEQQNGQSHIVSRFESERALDDWVRSDDYDRIVGQAERLAARRMETVSASCARVTLPSEAVAPKWKTFITTWAAVYPLILLLGWVIGLLGLDLPQPVELLITTMIMSATIIWLILPMIQRWTRVWRLGDQKPHSKAVGSSKKLEG